MSLTCAPAPTGGTDARRRKAFAAISSLPRRLGGQVEVPLLRCFGSLLPKPYLPRGVRKGGGSTPFRLPAGRNLPAATYRPQPWSPPRGNTLQPLTILPACQCRTSPGGHRGAAAPLSAPAGKEPSRRHPPPCTRPRHKRPRRPPQNRQPCHTRLPLPYPTPKSDFLNRAAGRKPACMIFVSAPSSRSIT